MLFMEWITDGLQKIIISTRPPDIFGRTGALTIDALRQGMQTACAASVVPCYFLDLELTWEDNYYDFPPVNPNYTGAAHIADEIWSIMQENCIAQ